MSNGSALAESGRPLFFDSYGPLDFSKTLFVVRENSLAGVHKVPMSHPARRLTKLFAPFRLEIMAALGALHFRPQFAFKGGLAVWMGKWVLLILSLHHVAYYALKRIPPELIGVRKPCQAFFSGLKRPSSGFAALATFAARFSSMVFL